MATKTLKNDADIVYAAKAIHDDLKDRVNDLVEKHHDAMLLRLNKLVNHKFKSLADGGFTKELKQEFSRQLEQEFATRLFAECKTLDAIHAKKILELDAQQQKRFDALSEHVKEIEDNYARKSLALEGWYAKRLDDLRDAFDAKLNEMSGVYQKNLDALTGHFAEQASRLTKSHDDVIEQVKSILAAYQPAPPVVNVTTPEPVVNVNVPELSVPEINIQQPAPRLITKHIDYDDHGRPSTITEQEM